jgi:hypothetical protein
VGSETEGVSGYCAIRSIELTPLRIAATRGGITDETSATINPRWSANFMNVSLWMGRKPSGLLGKREAPVDHSVISAYQDRETSPSTFR